MASVLVEIGVADKASARLAGMADQLKELAKVAKQAGSPDAARLSQGAQQLANVANNFGQVRKEAASTAKTLDSAREAMGAFTSSAGLGLGKALLGLGGAVAFAAAAGKIIGDSIKLAAQFEKVSQRATFSLGLGQGNLIAQLNALKQSAGAYAGLGFDKTQAVEMIGTYGQASGATLRQSMNNGQSIAQYSRGFGMDPMQLAQQMGMLAQYAGKNNDRNSSEVFGAARSMGDAGRRPQELLGNVVTLLSQMQASNPMGHEDLKGALKELVGVTSLKGSYYQSQSGIQNTVAGYNAIGRAVGSNPALTNLAMRSGWSVPDILFGNTDPGKLSSLLSNAYKQTGGNKNILASVVSSIVPGEQGRAVFEALLQNHGNITGDFKNVTKKALQAADDAYEKTPEGQMAKAAAEVKNAEITLGDAIIKVMAPKIASLTEGINKFATDLVGLNFPAVMKDVMGGMKSVADAIISTLPKDRQAEARHLLKATAVGFGVMAIGAGSIARDAMNFGSNAGEAMGEAQQNLTDMALAPFGRASDQVSAAKDANFQSRMLAGKVGGPWNTPRMLLAIRQQESSNNYGAIGHVDVPEMGGRALGAYQFMPDTLMGTADGKASGYAQSMDPALLKKLGRKGFAQYYLSHPAMQDRYEGAMLQNAIASGVSNPLEYGVYHLSGGGGFAKWKAGHKDSYDGLGTSQTREGMNINANYQRDAGYRFVSYRDTAAHHNSAHPAHNNSGSHHSVTNHKVDKNTSVQVSVKVNKDASSRTVASTSRS